MRKGVREGRLLVMCDGVSELRDGMFLKSMR
jgi:hypothetical protein